MGVTNSVFEGNGNKVTFSILKKPPRIRVK